MTREELRDRALPAGKLLRQRAFHREVERGVRRAALVLAFSEAEGETETLWGRGLEPEDLDPGDVVVFGVEGLSGEGADLKFVRAWVRLLRGYETSEG